MSTLIFIILSLVGNSNFNITEFYQILSSNDEKLIITSISKLEKNKASSTNKVYLSALYMKQSDFEKDLKTKIEKFKKGAMILEEEISLNTNNVEYRFIRLIIQENSPKILKYNQNIIEDKQMILDNFSKLETQLKSEIEKYAKNSKVLILD